MLAARDATGAGERTSGPFLARALSIAAHARTASRCSCSRTSGPGTARLCSLRAGEGVWAWARWAEASPRPPTAARALLVGGGVGIAPLAILQDQLAGPATALLGFRGAAHAAGARCSRAPASPPTTARPATTASSRELLAARARRGTPRRSSTPAGPAAMLESVRALCERSGVPAQLALEAPMACGFGACYGCVVPRRGGGYLRVCVDGPVIDGAELERVDEHAGSPA